MPRFHEEICEVVCSLFGFIFSQIVKREEKGFMLDEFMTHICHVPKEDRDLSLGPPDRQFSLNLFQTDTWGLFDGGVHHKLRIYGIRHRYHDVLIKTVSAEKNRTA